METFVQIILIIAMLSLFLSILTFIVSLFKYGIKEGFSLKTKLTKTSLGLLGVYGVFIVTLLVLIN